jgi:hypothetical protein
MKNIDYNKITTIFGGSSPYCDGREAGRRFRDWLGWLGSSFYEGMLRTNEAMTRGK